MPLLLRSSIAKPDSDDTRVETTMLGHDLDFRFSGLSICLVALLQSPGQLLGDPRSSLALASRRRHVGHVFLFEIHHHRVLRSHEFWPHVFGDAGVKELEIRSETRGIWVTEREGFKAGNGGLRQVGIDGGDDLGNVGLREPPLDARVFEFGHKTLQLIQYGGGPVGRFDIDIGDGSDGS